MDSAQAVGALGALAHGGRLEAFRLLVRAGPGGMASGEIARATGSRPNTTTTSLSILAAVGLVASRREGRSVIYAAEYDRMRELLAFLIEDCCGGKPEICAPLAALAGSGCEPEARCA